MPTFIDIGAFKGEITKRAIEGGYFVYAFEPNPNMKPFLQKHEEQAVINYAAAWNEDGNKKLYLMARPDYDFDEDGVSLVEDKTNVDPKRFIEVPTINIGKYLKELDKDIAVIKINSEGAEYIIIESILNEFDPTRIKRWLVEDHSNYISAESWHKKRAQVLARLYSLGITLEEWNNVTNILK